MGQAFSGLAKRGAIAGVMGLPRPSVESNFGVQQNKALIMANFLSQKWLLPRRHFLRGLGVSLGLPMLDCMRPLAYHRAGSGRRGRRPAGGRLWQAA